MKNDWLMGLLLLMTLMGALGSVFFKYFTLKRQYYFLLTGFFFYGLGALLNIYLLIELPYTLVLPASAFTFIWTLILAKWLFKETIGISKIAGIAFIIFGLFLLIL